VECVATVQDPAPERAGPERWRFATALAGVLFGYVLGPIWTPVGWTSLAWLAPIAVAVHLAWTGNHARRLLALLLGWAVLLCLDAFSTRTWWLAHFGLGLSLATFAIVSGPARREGRQVLALVVALVLPQPWIALGELAGFWAHCVRLRTGMSPAQVLGHFDEYWVQAPGTQDGCERLAVAELDGRVEPLLEERGDEECLLFYPYGPNEDEGCTADVCFVYFAEGRLARLWLSPD